MRAPAIQASQRPREPLPSPLVTGSGSSLGSWQAGGLIDRVLPLPYHSLGPSIAPCSSVCTALANTCALEAALGPEAEPQHGPASTRLRSLRSGSHWIGYDNSGSFLSGCLLWTVGFTPFFSQDHGSIWTWAKS